MSSTSVWKPWAHPSGMYRARPDSASSSTPNQRPCVGDSRRRSSATSKIAPRVQRTSFASSCGRLLVVHAPQRPGRDVPRERALRELAGEPGRGELLPAPRAGEEAAFVLVTLELDDVARRRSGSRRSASSPTPSTPTRQVVHRRPSSSAPLSSRCRSWRSRTYRRPSNSSVVSGTRTIGVDELLGAATGVPLERELGERPLQSFEKSTRYERGSGDASVGELDLAAGDLGEHSCEIADEVVLLLRADVERLAARRARRAPRAWRVQRARGRGRGRAAATTMPSHSEPDAPRRVRPPGEVVEHDVEPQPRRHAVDRRVAHRHDDEVVVGERRRAPPRLAPSTPRRRQRPQWRVLVEQVVGARRAVHRARRREDEAARRPPPSPLVRRASVRVEVDVVRPALR